MSRFRIGDRVCLSGYSSIINGEVERYFGTGTVTNVHNNPIPVYNNYNYHYYVSWDGADRNDETAFYRIGPFNQYDLELEFYQHFLDKIKDRL